MLARAVRFATLLPILLLLSGCSADSVTPPEPTVRRPGSFVALTNEDGGIFLIRTLRVVPFEDGESLFEAIHYQGLASSHDEARRWAKDPNFPVFDEHAIFLLQSVLSLDPEVVWYRTLTESELAALR